MKLDPAFLDKKRYSSDEEADRIIEKLYLSDNLRYVYESVSVSSDLLPGFHSSNTEIKGFLSDTPAIPNWLDMDQLKMASEFYMDYASEIMMMLGAISLPTCYAASPGNKVLYLTKKIREKPGKRLLETAAFIIRISEPGAFEKGGPGFKAVQQIRLIHALARFHLQKAGLWNKQWGLPVNEEDMAGTNLAFSYIVLKALVESGFKIPEKRLNAYLHLWKFVGYQMKIDIRLLPDNMSDASILDGWIRRRNFVANQEGRELCRSLLEHYQEALPQGLNKLVESQIRYLIGSEVAEMIGLRSTLVRDLLILVLSAFQKTKNKWFKHERSYEQMKKDHERLMKIYAGR